MHIRRLRWPYPSACLLFLAGAALATLAIWPGDVPAGGKVWGGRASRAVHGWPWVYCERFFIEPEKLRWPWSQKAREFDSWSFGGDAVDFLAGALAADIVIATLLSLAAAIGWQRMLRQLAANGTKVPLWRRAAKFAGLSLMTLAAFACAVEQIAWRSQI